LAVPVSRFRFGLFVAAALVAAACDKVPLLAPTSSTIILTASTTFVPVFGTATVTAAVTESAGTPVQNGTVVTFTSSFGTIDPVEARTENGKASVRFIAGGQSGTAQIGAFSGGVRAGPSGASGGTGGTGGGVEIKVGGAAADKIVARADPASVPANGGSTTIIATVVDAVGNPLPGVPVNFTTDAGQLSAGQVVTDGAGEARTQLTTSRTTKVTATAGGKTADVTVNAQSPTVTIEPPTTIEANVAAIFNFTPPAASGTTNPLRSVLVNWGDGSPLEGLGAISVKTPVAHTYRSPGIYRITATVTDTQGIVGETSISISVNSQSSLSVTLTASPNPVSVGGTSQGLVSFTATAGGLGASTQIQAYYWSFGDNTPNSSATTTGPSTNHQYRVPGTYLATIEVVATNGQRGFNQIEIRVNQ
jgi:adhesin/invasin